MRKSPHAEPVEACALCAPYFLRVLRAESVPCVTNSDSGRLERDATKKKALSRAPIDGEAEFTAVPGGKTGD
jgi:hypothetical protein